MYPSTSNCEVNCHCTQSTHTPSLVVVTGGPGAGKTAILEMARKKFCQHVAILPEAASLVFSGGFWRLPSATARMAAQRAIFHVQKEMETLVMHERRWGLGLCDRGTLDGLAYWPGAEAAYWQETGTTEARELARYKAVIHLRTPGVEMGYNYQNALRVETADEARAIDQRIEKIWSRHPRYAQIDSATDFLQKAAAALQLIADDVPECCRNRA